MVWTGAGGLPRRLRSVRSPESVPPCDGDEGIRRERSSSVMYLRITKARDASFFQLASSSSKYMKYRSSQPTVDF
jgi:hypothetical protein